MKYKHKILILLLEIKINNFSLLKVFLTLSKEKQNNDIKLFFYQGLHIDSCYHNM